ncbi:MAG: AbrB family transcriptional regulator [Anderseniella sp.]|jgi:membrane AbrB-like protein|nr:AbrB family transcriptional regulator [Anderseniella sp.]
MAIISREQLQQIAGALVIGTFGGTVFWWAGLPAPWLAGAMVAVAIAALGGAIRTAMPKAMTRVVFILLGLQIGGAVTPETLDTLSRWPSSIALLALTMAVLVAVGVAFYRRVFGWDRATSFFAVMPGALSLSLAMAADTRADLAKVSVVQVIRLFALVAVLPSLISGFSGGDAGSAVMPPAGSLKDVILVLGAGIVAGFVFDKLKVPAGLMLGPALASGVMHLTGVVHGVLPNWLLLPGFVFLGTMIGMRFAGVRPADIVSMGGAALSGLAVALVISTLGAAVVSHFVGIPFSHTMLAFAPGGLEAMTIMAFALNLDPAYVGGHQIARYVMIALAMPIAWALLQRLGREPADQ